MLGKYILKGAVSVLVIFVGFFTSSLCAYASEEVYYLHNDHLGSTSIVTQGGTKVSEFKYYPYGTDREASSRTLASSVSEKGYTGQISDEIETGLFYYNARYYDSSLAVFTQPDSIKQLQNGYNYVSSNPINKTDPTGHMFTEPQGGVGGSIIRSTGKYEKYEKDKYKKCGGAPCIDPVNPEDDDIMPSPEPVESQGRHPDLSPLEKRFKDQRLEALFSELGYDTRFYNELLLRYYNIVGDQRFVWAPWSETFVIGNLLHNNIEYQEGSFVCRNFTDLTSLSIQKLIPEVIVYAAGVKGKPGNGGHAFTIVESPEYNDFWVIDSTWGERNSLDLYITNQMYDPSNTLDWKTVHFNPKVSSPEASWDRLAQYLLEAGVWGPPISLLK